LYGFKIYLLFLEVKYSILKRERQTFLKI